MARKNQENRQQGETLATMLAPIYEERMEELLGTRLREMRRQKGYSLRSLAEKSDLSANTLSLIENGKTSPSVSTLQQIAIALNIPITTFFEDAGKKNPVIYTRRSERVGAKFLHGKLEELGSGVGNMGLQPFVITFNPHTNSGPQPLTHDGSEVVYCLSGKVIYRVADVEYALEPGDSLFFASKVPHSWYNPLETTSQVIIVLAHSDDRNHATYAQIPV